MRAVEIDLPATRVLVIDDDRLVRDALLELLTSAGWVREASADVGIVVMSGSLDRHDPTGDGERHRLVIVPKPFPLEDLIGIIDRLVPSTEAHRR